MSWRVVCPGCMAGNHDEHVRDWNIRPGLIGGSWCDCEGDPGCTERAQAAAERLLAHMFPPAAVPDGAA
jgi:hypothetical protein